ncbi:uncharacterized protein N7483_011274 [Penicillium malachiteum]|uniref:uncharacterized protein n=1 Tax=Penicillium malachiteum TaxID=1324776 RepID=UPI002546A08F|nr:uncharacterized protein N7483_011274 [Penicillium malachiteum]KAJ5714093.1 hypothetical protein N7483_011274 [Penicillium malachiteum]
MALSASLLVLFLEAKNFHHSRQLIHIEFSHDIQPLAGAGKDPIHPLRLTECTDATPSYYAPCLAQTLPHALAGEELLYPGLSITPPIFASSRPQDAEKWWNTTWLLWDRAYKLDTRLRYPEKHGQIYLNRVTTDRDTGRKGDKPVRDLWSSLGYPPDHVLHRDTSFVASKLIWGCRAPLIHPRLTKTSLSLLAPDSLKPVPVSDRNLILYMTRSNGLTRDKGREVINEDVLLAGIRSVLDFRGNNEKLEIFNHNDFPDMKTLIRYLQQNVKAVVGPHGSALHHHLWTAPDTLVVEFQPTSRPDLTFYESAKMRDQPFAVLMEDPVDEKYNMLVDLSAVVQTLEGRLGRELEVGDKIELGYDWEAEELAVV